MAPTDPVAAAYAKTRQAYVDSLLSKTATALAAGLAGKQKEPQLAAFATLFEHIRQRGSTDYPAPPPAWTLSVTRQFVRMFHPLDAASKQ